MSATQYLRKDASDMAWTQLKLRPLSVSAPVVGLPAAPYLGERLFYVTFVALAGRGLFLLIDKFSIDVLCEKAGADVIRITHGPATI